MTRPSVDYVAPPTLQRFMLSDAFVRASVGPVGSGKSSACVVELLKRAMQQRPGPDGVRRSRFVVIRNTYSQLRDTTRKTFEQWVPAGKGAWNEQAFTWTLDSSKFHCEVLFRALDRPEDVQKLLSLELTGAYINEAREIPKSVLDVLETRVGRYPARIDGGPSWFGIWMDTNPWPTSHWGYKLFTRQRPAGYELFEQPGGRTPEAENVDNLPPGYYERLVSGKDAQWIESYIDGRYPSFDSGSVYGDLIAAIEKRGDVLDFYEPIPGRPLDGIHTTWDLGISDSTAIWFWRVGAKSVPDVVDHYENHGRPLSHFFDVVDARGYKYQKHWLPHDARARSLQTGASVLEQFVARYGSGNVAIGPELSVPDGIAAARWLLERPVRFNKTRCAAGLDALRAYHYDWDEDTRALSRKPAHDWSSHTADAWRYVACVFRNAEIAERKDTTTPPPPVRTLGSFALDELWDTAPRAATGRI